MQRLRLCSPSRLASGASADREAAAHSRREGPQRPDHGHRNELRDEPAAQNDRDRAEYLARARSHVMREEVHQPAVIRIGIGRDVDRDEDDQDDPREDRDGLREEGKDVLRRAAELLPKSAAQSLRRARRADVAPAVAPGSAPIDPTLSSLPDILTFVRFSAIRDLEEERRR